MTDPINKISAKIAALLRLAEHEGTDANEAVAAAAKARALMDQRQISEQDLPQDEQSIEQFIEHKFGYSERWSQELVRAYSKLHDCEHYLNKRGVRQRWKAAARGYRDDVLLCKISVERVVRICKDTAKARGIGRYNGLNAFNLGFSQALCPRIYELACERQLVSSTNALVVAKKENIESHFGKIEGTLSRPKPVVESRDWRAVDAGLKLGHAIAAEPEVEDLQKEIAAHG